MTTKFLTIKFANFSKSYCHGIFQEKRCFWAIFPLKFSPPPTPSKTQILILISSFRRLFPSRVRIVAAGLCAATLFAAIVSNPQIFRRRVQTRCIVKGEAHKSRLFWRFSGGLWSGKDPLGCSSMCWLSWFSGPGFCPWPGLPPSSRSLRLCLWASILLYGPVDIAWICCPQLPHHPCKNGTHSTCFDSTGGHTPIWVSQECLFCRNSTRRPLNLIANHQFLQTPLVNPLVFTMPLACTRLISAKPKEASNGWVSKWQVFWILQNWHFGWYPFIDLEVPQSGFGLNFLIWSGKFWENGRRSSQKSVWYV